MSILTFVAAACLSAAVRVTLMTSQPLQPFTLKYGSPCKNVSEDGCVGGYPFIAASFREGKKGVDAGVGVASFMQITRLVQNHPKNLALNDEVWGHAGISVAHIRSPYLFSWSSFIEDIDYLQRSNLSILMTNVVEENALFAGSYDYYTILEPIPGFRLALLVVFPREFYVITRPIHPQITNLNTFLRQKHGVDAVVVIGPVSFTAEEFALLQQTGVDAVVIEDHYTGLIPPFWNQTWVIPVTGDVHSMPSFVLDIDDTTKKVVAARDVNAYTPSTMPDSFLADPQYAADQTYTQVLVDEASANDEVLGTTTTAMPDGHVKFPNGSRYDSCRHEECHLGTLMAKAMISARGAEIALCNGGSIRSGWPAGEVTRSMIEGAFPYQNNLCHLNMTAAELWRALENSVSTVSAAGDFDAEAAVTGQFMQLSGLRVTFDPSRAAGSRILSMETREGEEWVDIDVLRQYSVVTTKFICLGGDGYDLTPFSGSVADIDGADSWALIAKHLESLTPYTPHVEGTIALDYNKTRDSLKLAKTAEDCGVYARFTSVWEGCIPCFFGGYHPVPGEDQCVPEPIPAPPTDYVTVVVPVVGGLALLVAVGLYFWWGKHKSALEKLVRHAPRSGEVTIIFTDILQSSALWGEEPEAMVVALERHHTLARRLIEKHKGYEVKTIGDSFMIAFSDPVNAVEFACDLQVGLFNTEWPAPLLDHKACYVEPGFSGLRVRVGVHIGTPVVKMTPQGGFDYEGGIVNECARVSDSGCGGQVLVTEKMYNAVEPYLDDLQHVVDVKYLGDYKFKGISRSVSCLQLLPEELLSRRFSVLRNAELVVAEEATSPQRKASVKSMLTTVTEADLGKKEWISAMQVLRRHVISYGHGGIPVGFFGALLAFCIDAKLIEEVAMITALVKVYSEKPAVTPQHHVPDTPHTNSSTSSGAGVKWGTVVHVLNALPRPCIVHMSLKLQGDHGGMPLSATTASEADYRVSHFPSPDLNVVVHSFSDMD